MRQGETSQEARKVAYECGGATGTLLLHLLLLRPFYAISVKEKSGEQLERETRGIKIIGRVRTVGNP